MVDDDAVNDVGDVLERIDDTLEMLEDFTMDDELDGIAIAVGLEGWDDHSKVKEAMQKRAAAYDAAVTALIEAGRLSLDGLITHRMAASEANDAYPTAFGDPACLKMTLAWRDCS